MWEYVNKSYWYIYLVPPFSAFGLICSLYYYTKVANNFLTPEDAKLKHPIWGLQVLVCGFSWAFMPWALDYFPDKGELIEYRGIVEEFGYCGQCRNKDFRIDIVAANGELRVFKNSYLGRKPDGFYNKYIGKEVVVFSRGYSMRSFLKFGEPSLDYVYYGKDEIPGSSRYEFDKDVTHDKKYFLLILFCTVLIGHTIVKYLIVRNRDV